jgi:hypothetical protein
MDCTETVGAEDVDGAGARHGSADCDACRVRRSGYPVQAVHFATPGRLPTICESCLEELDAHYRTGRRARAARVREHADEASDAAQAFIEAEYPHLSSRDAAQVAVAVTKVQLAHYDVLSDELIALDSCRGLRKAAHAAARREMQRLRRQRPASKVRLSTIRSCGPARRPVARPLRAARRVRLVRRTRARAPNSSDDGPEPEPPLAARHRQRRLGAPAFAGLAS